MLKPTSQNSQTLVWTKEKKDNNQSMIPMPQTCVSYALA